MPLVGGGAGARARGRRQGRAGAGAAAGIMDKTIYESAVARAQRAFGTPEQSIADFRLLEQHFRRGGEATAAQIIAFESRHPAAYANFRSFDPPVGVQQRRGRGRGRGRWKLPCKLPPRGQRGAKLGGVDYCTPKVRPSPMTKETVKFTANGKTVAFTAVKYIFIFNAFSTIRFLAPSRPCPR